MTAIKSLLDSVPLKVEGGSYDSTFHRHGKYECDENDLIRAREMREGMIKKKVSYEERLKELERKYEAWSHERRILAKVLDGKLDEEGGEIPHGVREAFAKLQDEDSVEWIKA